LKPYKECVLWKFYGNQLRGFGVTEPPKRHFLYLTFIALTTGHILLKYFKLVFLQLQLVKISYKLIII